jgi:hypothetical protein
VLAGKVYPGDTVVRTYTFTDESGAVFDPDAVMVVVKDPVGVTVETFDLEDLEHSGTGVYVLRYSVPSDASAGSSHILVSVSSGLVVETEPFSFSVSSHPYGSLVVVRSLCGISDGGEDEVLEVFMAKATSVVDDALGAYPDLFSVPLVVVPDVVGSIAEFYAAGLYLRRNQLDEKLHPFLADAKADLERYISRQLQIRRDQDSSVCFGDLLV